MLVKEYRICMPMSVSEYRIGQLYMIQKKSRNESSGSESGVEILTNEPYEDGPGGSGQYTLKIYHVGSHLPGWIRSILPKSVHIEEEAWNAYPYTKTIYRCPFIEKFIMEIETVYHNDSGHQQNVFNLSKSDLSSRVVDYIDMVKDPIPTGEYQLDEDPAQFISQKTGRGPLTENWREEYDREIAGHQGNDGGKAKKEIMCAYKLCRVEFNYWGMQSKVERFIHDYALRRIMVRAHRQAWCWQDEYHGLTIEDIRRLELETQIKLREKMALTSTSIQSGSKVDPGLRGQGTSVDVGLMRNENSANENNANKHNNSRSGDLKSSELKNERLSFASLNKIQLDCKDIERLQNTSSDEDEEYFDADEAFTTFQRRSSLEDVSQQQHDSRSMPPQKSDTFQQSSSSQSLPSSPTPERKVPLSSLDLAGSEILFILLHGGSIVDTTDQGSCSKSNDLSTLTSTFESVIRSKYPSMNGRVFIEMMACPNLSSRPFRFLSAINPQRTTKDQSTGEGYSSGSFGANFPLSSVVLFGVNDPNYVSTLNQVRMMVNRCYTKFCQVSLRRNGVPFTGQVYILGDSIGSLFTFDLLTPPARTASSQNQGPVSLDLRNSNSSSMTNQMQEDIFLDFPDDQSQTPTFNSFEDCHENISTEVQGLKVNQSAVCRHISYPGSTIGQDHKGSGLDFDVDEVFLFGSPLGIVLSYRLHNQLYPMGHLPRPSCNQLYNLFYSSDPCAFRVEPLLELKFQFVEPVKLPRFNKFANDEVLSVFLVETIHGCSDLFGDSSSSNELNDNDDSSSTTDSSSGCVRTESIQSQIQTGVVESVTLNWWGLKRVDYSMYCPEVLQNFPPFSLPQLLHSSFWESSDLVAFILRQVLKQDLLIENDEEIECSRVSKYSSAPKEKWLKRKTTIKVRNVGPNHRGNDLIVLEGKPQILVARFMYGPLDVVSLSGEKVDIFLTVKGQREHISTEVTDANGRIVYIIPDEKQLPVGLYPIQMVVRVDQSSASFTMSVLPPKTEVIVFSIDGSFTASVSILGRDPKVRPGAVDVVRHWHDQGYLIHYITARPDMQHKMVVKWLAQHNFPQGLVWFTDGLSAEPLRQKASHLRLLIREAQIVVSSAYGSNKDVFVYQTIGLQPEQMFIIGKVSKKNRSEVTAISDGYASHLSKLQALPWRSVNPKLSFRTGGFVLNHPCPPKHTSKVKQSGDFNRIFRSVSSNNRSSQKRNKQEN